MGTSSSKSSRGHPSFPTADNKRRSSTRDSGNSFEVRKKEDVKERSDRLENKEILSYSDIQLQGEYALKYNDIQPLPVYRICVEEKKNEKTLVYSHFMEKTKNSLFCSKGGERVYESSYPKISA